MTDEADDTAGTRPFERLERLEVRLSATQVARLDATSRRLTKERRSAGLSGPRLNKSALIRVAVSVLIDARANLHGATEAEIADSLRRSLSAEPAAETVPLATRQALRQARRHVAELTELLDHAEPGPAASPQHPVVAPASETAGGGAPDTPIS